MMDISIVKYKTKTAGEEEIFLHLKECNGYFIPPLEKKVNIREYSKKIFERSVTFEAWADRSLIGLIAAYLNDKENHTGFITNVSIVKDYKGKGIASALIKMCFQHSKNTGIDAICLEVSPENKAAISFYKKTGFTGVENKRDVIVMKLKL